MSDMTGPFVGSIFWAPIAGFKILRWYFVILTETPHNTVSIIIEARPPNLPSAIPDVPSTTMINCIAPTKALLPGSRRAPASAHLFPRTAPGTWIDEQKLAETVRHFPTLARGAKVWLPRAGRLSAPWLLRHRNPPRPDDIFPPMALLEGRCAADAVRQAKPAT